MYCFLSYGKAKEVCSHVYLKSSNSVNNVLQGDTQVYVFV